MRVRLAIAAVAALCLFATGASAEIEIHEKHRFDAPSGRHSRRRRVISQRRGHRPTGQRCRRDGGHQHSKATAAQPRHCGHRSTNPVFKEEGDKLIIPVRPEKRDGTWKSVKAKGKGHRADAARYEPDNRLVVG